ncbi:3'-5' exonuclease [Streptomyces prunicolor]
MTENHTPLAFVDTETTHLDAAIGEAWEVAVILREFDEDGPTDTEYVWQYAPDLTVADPESLKIGRFEERFVVPGHVDAAFTGYEDGHIVPMTRWQAVSATLSVLRGAVLIGSNPGFDDRFLRKLCGSAPWHYRPLCIATMAAGYVHGLAASKQFPGLGETVTPIPFSSRKLSQAVGVEPPGHDVAHTALGDARWARDVFDAITGGAS